MKTERITESYLEYVNNCKNAEQSAKAKEYDFRSSRTSDKSFTGTSSFDEALDIAYNGWEYGLGQLPLEDGTLANVGTEINANVHGSLVNIGAFVQGLPDDMWEMTEKREYNLEELVFYCPLMYNAGITVDQSLTHCQNLITIVNKYQSKYNVKIIGVFDSEMSSERFIHNVLIKDFNERFVLNNVVASFHTSFFRRLHFARIEEKENVTSGYGRTTGTSSFHKEIEEQSIGGKYKSFIVPTVGDKYGNFNEADLKRINW